ncbi:7,8-dihydroneopterin aldolase [Bacteroidia bacterium]|nr:7,8-dihydroneopterin aldolase [Bacteroidia bacterium]
MSYLELKEMKFFACHGVTEQERTVGNTYIVDLKIFFNFARATQSDDLNDTVNYAAVYALVEQVMATPSNLIEHVAARILHEVHINFKNIARTEVRVAKQNPPLGGDIKEAAVFLISNRRSTVENSVISFDR